MTHKDIDAAAIAAARAMIFDSVGYGQPPKASQFRKGQSGNPKGRPRKTPDPVFDASGTSPDANAAAMQRVLAEPVRLRDGGKLRKVSKAEALQRVREKKALSGESYSSARDLHRQLLEQDARARQAIIDDHAFWRHYLERRAADLAQARAAGTSPSQFWVEPEDITFPPNEPVEVRGPVTAEQVPTFAELELLRDALIAEAMYFGHYHCNASSDGQISMAAPMAGLIDRQLDTPAGADRTGLLVGHHGQMPLEISTCCARNASASGASTRSRFPIPRSFPQCRKACKMSSKPNGPHPSPWPNGSRTPSTRGSRPRQRNTEPERSRSWMKDDVIL